MCNKSLYLMMVLFSPALLGACQPGEDDAVEQSQLVVQHLVDSLQPAVSERVPRYLTATVYLDGTISMRGFAGCRRGRSRYDDVISNIDYALSEHRIPKHVYVFGHAKSSESLFDSVSLDRRRVQCPELYNRLENPDAALYSAIERDSSLLSLYVTDGVQSVRGAPSPGQGLGGLRNWIVNDRGSLAILAYRSDFIGRVWSEYRQVMLDSARIEARPFYIFLFARSDTALGLALNILRTAAPPVATMRFSPSQFKCDFERDVAVLTTLPQYRWSFIEPTLWSGQNAGISLGSFYCDVNRDYPMDKLRPTVSATWRAWRRRQFGSEEPVADHLFRLGEAETTYDPGESGIGEIRLRSRLHAFPAPQPRIPFGLYTVWFRFQPAGIPQGILDLSTDDDSQPHEFDRTYLFARMISELRAADLSRQQVSVSYHFTAEERRR